MLFVILQVLLESLVCLKEHFDLHVMGHHLSLEAALR